MRAKLSVCIPMLSLLAVAGCEVGVEQPNTAVATQDATGQSHSPAAAPLDKTQLNFVRGYQQGYDQAMREGKPMLVFFTAEWCHYCHQMADEAFADQQVVSLAQHFVCVLVDHDAEPEVDRQFRVQNWPTVLFLSSRGVPLNRIVGKKPGHQVVMAMQAALQNIARRADSGTWR